MNSGMLLAGKVGATTITKDWRLMPPAQGVALDVNDVVRVRWLGAELGDLAAADWVIVATSGDRHTLTLMDTVTGDHRLTVDRAHVDPAGRRWVPRTCTCPRLYLRAADGSCASCR